MGYWRWAALAVLGLAGCVPETATTDAAPACRVTYVVDGDTLHMDCGAGRQKVRLPGFDTPELSKPHCAAEAEAARQARDLLAGLVASGPVTAVRFQGHDRYGRDLAAVSIAGRDVADYMIGTGLALPYAGHQHPDWCARL